MMLTDSPAVEVLGGARKGKVPEGPQDRATTTSCMLCARTKPELIVFTVQGVVNAAPYVQLFRQLFVEDGRQSHSHTEGLDRQTVRRQRARRAKGRKKKEKKTLEFIYLFKSAESESIRIGSYATTTGRHGAEPG
eukprot:4295880-Pyramimonas_sp.AAC.1